MNVNLFFSHIIITATSVFVFTYTYEYLENSVFEILYAFFHFAVILVLYIASGILATGKVFTFKKYYIIALIGIILWLIAFINSPHSLDYKQVKTAGLWFFYQLYVMGLATPFHMVSTTEVHIYFDMVLLLVLSIVPSILQAYGGYIKVKCNKRYDR